MHSLYDKYENIRRSNDKKTRLGTGHMLIAEARDL